MRINELPNLIKQKIKNYILSHYYSKFFDLQYKKIDNKK